MLRCKLRLNPDFSGKNFSLIYLLFLCTMEAFTDSIPFLKNYMVKISRSNQCCATEREFYQRIMLFQLQPYSNWLPEFYGNGQKTTKRANAVNVFIILVLL